MWRRRLSRNRWLTRSLAEKAWWTCIRWSGISLPHQPIATWFATLGTTPTLIIRLMNCLLVLRCEWFKRSSSILTGRAGANSTVPITRSSSALTVQLMCLEHFLNKSSFHDSGHGSDSGDGQGSSGYGSNSDSHNELRRRKTNQNWYKKLLCVITSEPLRSRD